MELCWHWLSKTKRGTIEINWNPKNVDDPRLINMSGGNWQLLTGDVIIFKTSDPVLYPLADAELLRLQYDLGRALHMAAGAGYYDFVFLNEPEAQVVAMEFVHDMSEEGDTGSEDFEAYLSTKGKSLTGCFYLSMLVQEDTSTTNAIGSGSPYWQGSDKKMRGLSISGVESTCQPLFVYQ
jgi:hypothetical protein